LECKQLFLKAGVNLLHLSLCAPPGKFIRLFVDHISDKEVTVHAHPPEVVSNQVGMSTDVPFSTLEEAALVRAQAACWDDTDIDLSNWAMPDEAPEQTHSRHILHRFTVKWWAY
jgi:hypothetical protein